MYRLMVKFGKDWKMGINVYPSAEDANKRKSQMEAVGHKVKVVKTDF